jgi:hypothetical protein
MNIKDMVKDKTVKFQFYRNKELWYITEDGFEFPVPISDTGNGSFEAEDKAIRFMRWIRKHLENIEAGKEMQYEYIDFRTTLTVDNNKVVTDVVTEIV